MTRATEPAWVVLVPVKRPEVAKSRLAGVTAVQRAELARAFPLDCVEAALRTPTVVGAVVVTDDSGAAEMLRGRGVEVVPDTPDAGLNPALEHGYSVVRARFGEVAVAVLSGDLPALRSDELSVALTRARQAPRAFLADEAGEGTTLLTAAAGTTLAPRFGDGSRVRHRAGGAHEIDGAGLASVRRDVDTWTDLAAAVLLGVGGHTDTVLRRHGLQPVHAD